MKIRLVTLLGLVISFALPTLAEETHAPDPKLLQALDDLFRRESEAYNNNDAAAIAATFAEDAIFVTTQGPFFGREAIEKYYASRLDSFCKMMGVS
ncbi:MAG TPA: SgcJ/EcaC family oxidoreductase [Chthoniobacterales bacterium]|jgi:ketosteroid isomerase-like protein|nr:SgcJ/EcaC family oxidoreductase [Chthoniobacterales bacterium]